MIKLIKLFQIELHEDIFLIPFLVKHTHLNMNEWSPAVLIDVWISSRDEEFIFKIEQCTTKSFLLDWRNSKPACSVIVYNFSQLQNNLRLQLRFRWKLLLHLLSSQRLTELLKDKYQRAVVLRDDHIRKRISLLHRLNSLKTKILKIRLC